MKHITDLLITVPAIVAICVIACLVAVLLFVVLRLRARSIENYSLIAEAAQREELERRERDERDRAITERIDNIASRRDAERVHSILLPNTRVMNI